ncbi:MAG: TIGR03986 family CRISPR-associated RAMP protein [Lachnospiraceae bacterium]|nr:TIGR03986 family CRISPR-associated RAMP protein [Lachnospiraceae bacterium]
MAGKNDRGNRSRYSGNRGGYSGSRNGNHSGNGGYDGKSNRNYGGYGGRNNNESSNYIGASYNFVPFSQNVIPYDMEKPVPHDAISEELLSGEIVYTITAKTPIMIDDGQEKFWRTPYGEEAIPGSSVRGLCRSNAQILSLSGVCDDVDDYALMYRNVASGLDRKYYNQTLGAGQITVETGRKKQRISILKSVRAGYLVNQDGSYFIYDTKIDRIDVLSAEDADDVMNYYVLSERKLAEEYQKSQKEKKKYRYPFFVKKNDDRNPEFITQHMLNRPFRMETDRRDKVHYKGKENRSYEPYALPCSFSLSGREVTGVDAPGVLKQDGYAVSTGKMNEKKAIYIIPKVDMEKKKTLDTTLPYQFPIEIPDADLKAFQADINKRKSTLKQFGGQEAFDLPSPGQENMRPVFYIQKGSRLYFGFTPRLRLFYEHTIREGFPEAHQQAGLDFTKAIFGYSGKNEKCRTGAAESCKSRVSFSDAVIQEQKKLTGDQYVILGEPKPTSCCDYVMPEGGRAKSYNDDFFQLRGIKQYWLRDKEYSNVPEDKRDKEYTIKFKALEKGTVFGGKVRFHNLRREELGLLLWSLHLDGKSWMNIGKAKAFGYGNIQLHVDSVKVLDTKKAYDLSAFILDPYRMEDRDVLIQEYKEFMNQILKKSAKADLRGKKIDQMEPVISFFKMKNPDRKPDTEKIQFMELKEYQNRKMPLGTISSVLGK